MTQLEILTQRVAALQSCYQTEMDAKNEAYLFIIESGNYDNYKDWTYARRAMGKTSNTAHAECLPALLEYAANREEVRYDA